MESPHYRKLVAWQKAHKNALWIIELLDGCHHKYSRVYDQCLGSATSVGANIAEGYSRFHFLDKIRFYYNSRASLSEAIDHWLELIFERELIDQNLFEEIKQNAKVLQVKLNNFISATYKQK